MKKRKKPIFLVAVLALLVVTVAAINANALGTQKSPDQVQAEANVQQASQVSQPSSAPQSAQEPSQPLVAPKEDGDDTLPMNVTPIPAVPNDGPKILAPRNMKDKQKSPDRASTLTNSGWYMSGRH